MNRVLTERLDTCSERVTKVLCHHCTLVVATLLLLLMIPVVYLPLKDRDGSDWILAAIIFISVGFIPLVCCKVARSLTMKSFKSIFKCETFNKASRNVGNCLLEVFCCPCMWIPVVVKARREQSENETGPTNGRQQRGERGSGSDNPLFISNESGQQIIIPTVNQGQGQNRRSRGRGKQYYLGALIELACQADRKTTQRHVDGLSVEGQGSEVHNLYHLYAILSLAHQADNARACAHYKEWSHLVSSEASTSRGRSDFYGLPTYEQAVALSLETNDIVDVNVLGSGDSRGGSQAYVPRSYNNDIPANVTIPTYEELMGPNPETIIDAPHDSTEEVNPNRGDNIAIDVVADAPNSTEPIATLPTYNDACNQSQETASSDNCN